MPVNARVYKTPVVRADDAAALVAVLAWCVDVAVGGGLAVLARRPLACEEIGGLFRH